MATYLAGQKLTAGAFNTEIKKILARGRRTTTSSAVTSSTDIGVLRLDDVSLKASRSVIVRVTGIHADSTVAADVMRMRLRYTTDGSTPTTSSTILPGSLAYAQIANASWPETRVIEAEHTPAADQTFSVLLCISRTAGTGDCTLFADADHALEMKIIHDGDDVGDTGTDI